MFIYVCMCVCVDIYPHIWVCVCVFVPKVCGAVKIFGSRNLGEGGSTLIVLVHP